MTSSSPYLQFWIFLSPIFFVTLQSMTVPSSCQKSWLDKNTSGQRGLREVKQENRFGEEKKMVFTEHCRRALDTKAYEKMLQMR